MTSELVGHYRILSKIGSGGMGDVYRARDERLGRDVALKFISGASAADPDRIRRFNQEARAAAALNHPNIVAVYDSGVHENAPYIVSELLEGCTLREQLRIGPLPVRQAIDFGLQIAHGLMAAHEKLIIHRDLKPENLFLTKHGRIKILDFGIAKLLPAADGHSMGTMATQTKMGAVLGTVAYMSPEQLRSKPVDGRSDIFSLGAILYEMLTGRRAFGGETDVDTITAVLKEHPPELTVQRGEVPEALERVVNHCLEKDPEKRFQSVSDLAFSLGALHPASPTRAAAAASLWLTKRLPLSVAAIALVAGVSFLASRAGLAVRNPEYRRLTYARGTVYGARFAPDGTVVYEAAWNGGAPRLFSTSLASNSPLTHPLQLPDAHLLAVSPSNELALQVRAERGAFLDYMGGVLAQAPAAGGSPRELLEDVRWADWDSHNRLAVVHHVKGHSLLEYPIGKVLFDTTGWISHIRLSPDGKRIALMEHPAVWDDRGYVTVVDLNGRATRLTPEYSSEFGLAWSPRGNEVWYTAAKAGYAGSLMAVSLSGKMRELLVDANRLYLQDVAPDGRVLLSAELPRLALEVMGPNDKAPRDLSWYDGSVIKDISNDGQWILFEEYSEPFGINYAVAARKLDGSAPIRLGEGSAGGLSPDGKWALDVSIGSTPHVTLLPVGPGQPRDVPILGLEHVQNGSARFFPDGRRIALNGNEPGHGVRGYFVGVEGGKVHALTPEGMSALRISPDGRWVLAQPSSGPVVVCSVEGSTVRQVPGLTARDNPAQWAADSTSFYTYRVDDWPVRIERVNINTGERTLVREVYPSERNGVVSVKPITMTLDGSVLALSYYQDISTLYVVQGAN